MALLKFKNRSSICHFARLIAVHLFGKIMTFGDAVSKDCIFKGKVHLKIKIISYLLILMSSCFDVGVFLNRKVRFYLRVQNKTSKNVTITRYCIVYDHL